VIEKCCLLCRVLTQFGELVDAAGGRFFLFSLVPALFFIALPLLPCVFLLTLCKR